MDSPLQRTSSNGSDNAVRGEIPPLSPTSSTAGSYLTTGPPLKTSRSPSAHSLLASSYGNPVLASTSKSTMNRPSISMPPPLTKPSTDRRLSASITSVMSARKSEDVPRSPPASVRSFDERSPFVGGPHGPTTAMDNTAVTTASTPQFPGLPVLSPSTLSASVPNYLDAASSLSSQAIASNMLPRSDSNVKAASSSKADGTTTALPQRAPRNTTTRSVSTPRRLSNHSGKGEGPPTPQKEFMGRIGVCAMDVKARSRPSRQILTRLQGDGEFEVIIFGDKAITDEGTWKIIDFYTWLTHPRRGQLANMVCTSSFLLHGD